MIFTLSVFPAPLSPLTRIDWLPTPSFTPVIMLEYADSAAA
jgi:hypothetical protein